MKTAIVTDSNSGISRETAREWGVYVVPMPVIIENRIYYEGVDLFPEEFFRLQREGKHISTSQPAPDDLLSIWNSVLKEGYDELVYLPMTSGLSSSCQTASVLAAGYGGKVLVADHHQISVPQKNAVWDARQLAEKGASGREIKEKLETTGSDSIIYIGVNTLEHLKKGGRITPAAAAMGTVLQIKPLLVIKGEKLDTFAKVRGTKQCRARLLEAMQKSAAEYRAQGLQIRVDASGSFETEEEAQAWHAMAAQAFPGEPVQYDPLTLSIAAHTGPGAFAMGISRVVL